MQTNWTSVFAIAEHRMTLVGKSDIEWRTLSYIATVAAATKIIGASVITTGGNQIAIVLMLNRTSSAWSRL